MEHSFYQKQFPVSFIFFTFYVGETNRFLELNMKTALRSWKNEWNLPLGLSLPTCIHPFSRGWQATQSVQKRERHIQFGWEAGRRIGTFLLQESGGTNAAGRWVNLVNQRKFQDNS